MVMVFVLYFTYSEFSFPRRQKKGVVLSAESKGAFVRETDVPIRNHRLDYSFLKADDDCRSILDWECDFRSTLK